MKTETVTVNLNKRSYDIVIGPKLINKATKIIASHLPSTRLAIVTDANVSAIYLPTFQESLAEYDIGIIPVVVDAGEKSKSFPVLETVIDSILAAKLERGDTIIALGGGVIGDLTGFAAGIVRRGIGFIQIPTSLLAQVDSSVGGKTGINTTHGKNLVGVFYQPKLVIADTAVLDTLPLREFRAGYAEIVKYGLIDQPGFFRWLEKNWRTVFSGGAERVEAIACSCRFKAAVVERDEHEAGERALLNLGHTFGHALETATGYDAERLIHGEGVAIGMVLAHEFSVRLNLASSDLVERIRRHLHTAGLPTQITHIPGSLPDADTLMTYIAQDKKVTSGALTFILTRGLGQAFIAKDVPQAEVRAFLLEKLSRHIDCRR
ncbi:MAG: 3-dehydroquinate synthase [Candidatus Tokpelaia sp. JSC189]|nr:MAG: 3-dehydroquinate synthase [Candidatus Tokpelaia sp. JSC189]